MNRFPIRPDRYAKILDGLWDFAWLGDISTDQFNPSDVRCTETASVPGCFDTAGIRIGKRGAAVYRLRVEFPEGPARLTIGGLGLYGKIYWDSQLLREVKIPYSTIACDISCSGGVHTLTILVDNRFGDERKVPIFKPYADFYGFGGIYRSVKLEQLPEKIRIDRVKVETTDLATGRVRLKLLLEGNDSLPEKISFRYHFDYEQDIEVEAPVRNASAEIECTVPHFKIWSPESPNLHTVSVQVQGDRITERFGLRTITVQGQKILLNGKPLQIRGVNRHQSHPNFGPVEPGQLIMDDISWLKELNANFIRGAHYQQNPEFLEFCDQNGLLVWNESLGWQQPESDAENPETVALLAEATRIMVHESFNNPSVILYGFCNESCSHTPSGRKLYQKLVETIRSEDSTRLVTYASNHADNDLCFDLVDVISINSYPGWIPREFDWVADVFSGIRQDFDYWAEFFSQPQYNGKPLLISESGACGLFGVRDRMRAQWSEEFQADYFHDAVIAVLENPRYCGTVLWQMFDCRSYVNVGVVRTKTRGYNCAGLLDEYRRPKLAFDTVKQLFEHYQK